VASGWVALFLVRSGRITHLPTDPLCVCHISPRDGSWLDLSSRGIDCPICIRINYAQPVSIPEWGVLWPNGYMDNFGDDEKAARLVTYWAEGKPILVTRSGAYRWKRV
jgi:hypothetical protein